MTIPIEALRRQKAATEPVADRRSLEDPRAELLELERQGELIVQKIDREAVTVSTKYGREKRIQKSHLWHHKSCGQCGHIPGYSTSIFWVMRKLGYDYHDPSDQTSCTAWNYYASATSNAAAQAAVAVRNFAASVRERLLPADPLRHLLRSLQRGARGAHRPPRAPGAGPRHHGQAGQAARAAGGDRALLRVVPRIA